MNAQAFRHFYNYHFSENRKIWDSDVSQLSDEQFTQDVGYSHGSVRDQIVHLMSVDDTWFSGLRGLEIPASLNPADFDDRAIIRAHWDSAVARVLPLAERQRSKSAATAPFGGTTSQPRECLGSLLLQFPRGKQLQHFAHRGRVQHTLNKLLRSGIRRGYNPLRRQRQIVGRLPQLNVGSE